MSTLTLTGIQADLYWEDKSANLRQFEAKINAIQEKTEVIVLPEMFSTGFSMQPEKMAETMDGESVRWMKRVAATKKVVLTGSLVIEEGGSYFNRLIWMLPNGQCGHYDKRHLFAFSGEDTRYRPGNKRLIASVNGWKINLLVCYDLRFPVWSRQAPSPAVQPAASELAGLEFDLLVYVANWPERRSHAWKSLLIARAIENQCYVLGVNRVGEDGSKIYHSGDSALVDPLGKLLYSKADEQDVFTHTIHKKDLEDIRHKFPFWKDADRFVIDP
jgi:omega-amidase